MLHYKIKDEDEYKNYIIKNFHRNFSWLVKRIATRNFFLLIEFLKI